MDVCLKLTSSNQSTPPLRLKCIAMIADLARRSADLSSDEFPQVSAVVDFAHNYMVTWVMPELEYSPGATRRVMQAVGVEYIFTVYELGDVIFGNEMDAIEPTLAVKLAALADHPRVDTRLKVIRILSKRLRVFTPDQQRMMIDVVYPGL